MYNIVTNPIPKSGLFTTPASLDEVLAFISRLPKGQRVEAMMVAQMVLNWAHNEVEDKILSREIFAG